MVESKVRAQYLEVHEWICAHWPVGAMDVIRETNKKMYDRMAQIANGIDALVAGGITNKTQQKQYAELLTAYKRIHELGILYASRHLERR